MELIKTLTGLFSDLAKNAKDRIDSRIGGAFLSSWVIINWRLVYYFIFNNDNVVTKIKYIDDNYINYLHNLYMPIVFAAAYILIYPTLSNLSTFIWTISDKWSKILSAKFIENKIPLYEDDKKNLLKSMREQAVKFEKEKGELEEQITSLNSALTNFEQPYEPEPNHYKNSDDYGHKNNGSQVSTKPSQDFDSSILAKLNTDKGRYLLNEKLAKVFHLEVDNSLDKPELSYYCEVYKSVIKAHPAGFEPRHIKINNTQLDINQVKKFLERLIKAGIIQVDGIEDNTYILSNDGKELSLRISKEVN